LERTVLSHLIYNETYCRKVLPFLKEDYFSNVAEKSVFDIIQTYITKYNNLPTKEVIKIELDKKDGLSQQQYIDTQKVIENLECEASDLDWLINTTEKFCQEKALYNAIMESISIIDGKSKSKDKGVLPELLSDALSVGFDTHIGHSFLDDFEARYDFYHRLEEKVPFDIELLNKVTNGGLSNKTLNILMAATGGGKSLAMCHMAASNLMMGKNVLYITLEMSEERIAERIDANLMGCNIQDLNILPKDVYQKKIDRIKRGTQGRLIIKEYPTAAGSTSHFRHLINELKIKKNFEPDIIYIDYINICASSRVKMGASVNTYMLVKAIAEEVRGLAIEYDVPIVTATQVNRGGMNSSDIDLTDTSESIGLPQTADLMLALISSEELEERGQLLVKQLKNRYADPASNRKFIVGIDRAKMKLYNVEHSAQEDFADTTAPNKSSKKKSTGDKPVFDNSGFGEQDFERSLKKTKKPLDKSGWTFT
jgi:replicative DNA helicase